MPKRAPRISDEVWERHKEEIIALYSASNLTLEQTRVRMESNHGFQASQNQYTKRLKDWGVTKNSPTNIWPTVNAKMKKRKREEGKDSEVSLHHKPLSSKKVQKEIARHVTFTQTLGNLESAPTPEGVTISTPACISIPGYREVYTKNLPSLRLRDEVLSNFQNMLKHKDSDSGSLFIWHGYHNPSDNGRGSTKTVGLPDSSSWELERIQRLQCYVEKVSGSTEEWQKWVAFHSSNWIQGAWDNRDSPSTLASNITSLVFMLANNILLDDEIGRIASFLRANNALTLLVDFCLSTSPLARIFGKRLFIGAVKSKDCATVQRLIEGGFNPSLVSKSTDLLEIAVDNMDSPMVDLLCKAGAKFRDNEYASLLTKPSFWEPGNFKMVQTLVAFGAITELSLKNAGHQGSSLIYAASSGSLTAVHLLLCKGANVNAYISDKYGTALQAAAAGGHLELVEMLIESGADVNAPDGPGYDREPSTYFDHSGKIAMQTSIQTAAEQNNIQLVQTLLVNGASPNSCPRPTRYCHPINPWSLRSSLQYAATNENPELLALLLSYGAQPDPDVGMSYGHTALQIAAGVGNERIVSLLLDAGADVNAPPHKPNDKTVIEIALGKGHYAIADILARHAALRGTPTMDPREFDDPQAAALKDDGRIGLLHAIYDENLTILETLIQNGADVDPLVDYFEETPLYQAIKDGWFDGVKCLLEHGAQVNKYAPTFDDVLAPDSALALAIQGNFEEIVELLLGYGADVTGHSKYGPSSALNYALCLFDNEEIISQLLNTDGVLTVTHLDLPPLAVATFQCQDKAILELILDEMVALPKSLRDEHIQIAWDILLANEDRVNYYWLHDMGAIDVLLKNGADINSRHHDDKTTVLTRGIRAPAECILDLIENGADVNTPATENNGTPLQEAMQWGNWDTINLLLEHGTDINAPPARNGGRTALQAAAIHGYVAIAITLLQRGAVVDEPAAPIGGITAIDAAAKYGQLDMLQLLLNEYRGSEDIQVVCRRAAVFADEKGHVEIAEWLRGYPDASLW
ncbi:hypothetical protein ASPZODRAFT_15459 [Penicilliopsis zonata CBS 506.65]|uniref:Clr5 domain-containing protein n=1 Tax=Penicilliopsis zonata CBS 506.65 TaxID=1073090 RepID=A0A1L9SLK0_9EURO|nr:hypothetical protein ASPZODRAFT_15459 [Penicilliopsis zonata CBS 506.65]OJJ48013.1 hypothetical protein ASPZODRAFT_15459 [Penicilliopsis zonata CBS 506.65]